MKPLMLSICGKYAMALVCALLTGAPMRAAEITKEVASNSFTNFAMRFPAAFWRAGDAYFKSLGQSGHSMACKDFTNDNKAIVLSVKKNPQKRWVGSLKLADEKLPEDYWVLDFVYRDGKWRTLKGTKFWERSRIDLYAQQLGAPSMRPFVDKEIEKIQ